MILYRHLTVVICSGDKNRCSLNPFEQKSLLFCQIIKNKEDESSRREREFGGDLDDREKDPREQKRSHESDTHQK